jgi:hypothetical protein
MNKLPTKNTKKDQLVVSAFNLSSGFIKDVPFPKRSTNSTSAQLAQVGKYIINQEDITISPGVIVINDQDPTLVSQVNLSLGAATELGGSISVTLASAPVPVLFINDTRLPIRFGITVVNGNTTSTIVSEANPGDPILSLSTLAVIGANFDLHVQPDSSLQGYLDMSGTISYSTLQIPPDVLFVGVDNVTLTSDLDGYAVLIDNSAFSNNTYVSLDSSLTGSSKVTLEGSILSGGGSITVANSIGVPIRYAISVISPTGTNLYQGTVTGGPIPGISTGPTVGGETFDLTLSSLFDANSMITSVLVVGTVTQSTTLSTDSPVPITTFSGPVIPIDTTVSNQEIDVVSVGPITLALDQSLNTINVTTLTALSLASTVGAISFNNKANEPAFVTIIDQSGTIIVNTELSPGSTELLIPSGAGVNGSVLGLSISAGGSAGYRILGVFTPNPSAQVPIISVGYQAVVTPTNSSDLVTINANMLQSTQIILDPSLNSIPVGNSIPVLIDIVGEAQGLILVNNTGVPVTVNIPSLGSSTVLAASGNGSTTGATGIQVASTFLTLTNNGGSFTLSGNVGYIQSPIYIGPVVIPLLTTVAPIYVQNPNGQNVQINLPALLPGRNDYLLQINVMDLSQLILYNSTGFPATISLTLPTGFVSMDSIPANGTYNVPSTNQLNIRISASVSGIVSIVGELGGISQ